MRLLFPQVSDRDCGDCHAWIYNEKTGTIETDAAGRPRKRSRHTPPGCSVCPKRSPAEAWRFELSRRNEATWDLYRQLSAAPYLCPEEWRGDPWLLLNFGICKRVEEEVAERRALTAESRTLALLRQMQAAAAAGRTGRGW